MCWITQYLPLRTVYMIALHMLCYVHHMNITQHMLFSTVIYYTRCQIATQCLLSAVNEKLYKPKQQSNT